jgi:hypothetical protein
MSGLSSEELTGKTDVMMIAQLEGFVDQKSERSDQGGKLAITNEQNETVPKIGRRIVPETNLHRLRLPDFPTHVEDSSRWDLDHHDPNGDHGPH